MTVNVSAIVLAAGLSTRMGEQNKLALDIAGTPLLRRTVEMLLQSTLNEVIVVVGFEQATAREILNGLAVKIVTNEQYEQGQMTSVYRGMQAVADDCDGVMVCLSDQPLLTADDINQLVDGFAHRSRGSVLVPTFEEQRGNPIILAYQHRQAILSGDRNLGCKKLIQKHPELVETLAMNNDHVVFDLDTPDDYQRLLERLNDPQRQTA